MGIIEDVADELALESLKIIDKTGDDAFVQEVQDAIGGSSQTMEEAYATAVRVRRAEQRARRILDRLHQQMAQSDSTDD